MKPIFLSGIGTDVGKTVAAAVLCKAWGMDYWKPVQAGELDRTDSDRVREWTEGTVKVHPERFRLSGAMSPHAAARRDGVHIALEALADPPDSEALLIEGAGGLLVPINDEGDTMLDLARALEAEIILVSRHFLGSINQTLLSCELLAHRDIPLQGILFSGAENPESEFIIERISGAHVLGRIPEGTLGSEMVRKNAERFARSGPPFERE